MMNVLFHYPVRIIGCLAVALATTISPIAISIAEAVAITNVRIEFGVNVKDITNVTTGNTQPGDFIISAGPGGGGFDTSASGDATVEWTRTITTPPDVIQEGDQITSFFDIEALAKGRVFEDATASFFGDGAGDLEIDFTNHSVTDTYSVTLEIAYFLQTTSSVTLPGLEEASSSTYFDFVQDVGLPEIQEFIASDASSNPIDFTTDSFFVDLLFDPNENPWGYILFRPLSTAGIAESVVSTPATASLLVFGLFFLVLRKRTRVY